MTTPLRCFEPGFQHDQFDRRSFTMAHRLSDHPSLALENLGRVLPALPKEQVMYATGPLNERANFEATFAKRPEGTSISQVLESVRDSRSYIMISSPETHPSFKPLYDDLTEDVQSLMRARGISGPLHHAKLYLFIASPGAITPFHVDRYSTILLQFRGSKTVTVFPQWDQRVVSANECEAYCDRANTQLSWNESLEPLGTAHVFAPGDALHIPFMAGHHVRNGTDDVSISMSIIFNTPESMVWRSALCMNHRLRRRFPRLARGLHPVGRDPRRDRLKALAFDGIGATLGRLGGRW